ncbi:MAG: type II secretion system F family protein [Acidimicrobiales bacterium]
MNTLGIAVAGGVIGLGVFCLALAMLGEPPPLRVPAGWAAARRGLWLRVGLGAVAAAAVALLTRWPVGTVLAGLAGAALPSILGARARRNAEIAKLEALATWAEQLRDVIGAAEGIQGAIAATAPLAPWPIRDQVRRLAEHAKRGLTPALEQFALDVAHPLADMMVTALELASRHQGGALARVLGELARTARQSATMHARVEASRAGTYATARLVVVVSVGFVVGLTVLRRTYLEPFDSAAGQAMLALIGVIFTLGVMLLQRLARPTPGPRLMAGDGR